MNIKTDKSTIGTDICLGELSSTIMVAVFGSERFMGVYSVTRRRKDDATTTMIKGLAYNAILSGAIHDESGYATPKYRDVYLASTNHTRPSAKWCRRTGYLRASTNEGNSTAPTFILYDKAYQITKWTVMIVLPACITLWITLANIWHIPHGDAVLRRNSCNYDISWCDYRYFHQGLQQVGRSFDRVMTVEEKDGGW